MHEQNLRAWTFDPRDLDILHKDLCAVQVSNSQESSSLILEAFNGKDTPASNMIAINAAFAVRTATQISLEDAFFRPSFDAKWCRLRNIKKICGCYQYMNILDQIVAKKRAKIESRKSNISIETLQESISAITPTNAFAKSIQVSIASKGVLLLPSQRKLLRVQAS